MKRTLYIIRGHSGSGKTTLAKSLTDKVFEADHFFVRDGIYKYDRTLIKYAHAECLSRVICELQRNRSDIAVANTFTRRWEYAAYLDAVARFGYSIEIRVCRGNYPNVHGVPPEVIQDQKLRFEH